VCESDDFTVGGLISGLGVQSSSHRHGFFHANVEALEVVTGDGNITIATPTSDTSDLFINLPGSFGTLGLITGAVLRLCPCQPYVVSRYTPAASPSEFQAVTARQLGRSEFLEGIAFSLSLLVSVASDWASGDDVAALLRDASAGGKSVVVEYDPSRPGEPWYHQHVRWCGETQRKLAAGAGSDGSSGQVVSVMPTVAYLFRCDQKPRRGGEGGEVRAREVTMSRPCVQVPARHLVAAGLEAHVGMPAATGLAWVRKALDSKIADMAAAQVTARERRLRDGVTAAEEAAAKAAKQREELGELGPGDMARCFVTQGFVVRTERIAAMVHAVAEHLSIWPLWICGGKTTLVPGSAGQAAWRRRFPGVTELTLFDVGAYGEPMAPGFRSVSSVRALQAVCDMPSVWGMTFMTDPEIDELFDVAALEALRVKYKAVGAFVPFMDKVRQRRGGAAGGDGGLPPDLPKVPCWRLKRARLYTPCLWAVAVLVVLLVALFVGRLGGGGGGGR